MSSDLPLLGRSHIYRPSTVIHSLISSIPAPCYPYHVDHFRRIGLLRRRLTKAGLHGLLVTHLPDLRYLSGFTGSSAALAVTRRTARLFTDGRYKTQAAEEVSVAQVEIVASSPAVAAVQWLAAQPGVEFAGFDPAQTTRGQSGPLPGRAARAASPQLSHRAGRARWLSRCAWSRTRTSWR